MESTDSIIHETLLYCLRSGSSHKPRILISFKRLFYSLTGIEDWNAVAIECSSLASKWMSLGAYLGQTKNEYRNDSQSCWNDLLSHWIQQDYDTKRFGAPS